ncbi:MAG: monooxygenase, partial [Myxococcaceae bacterium]|nr:monooxygenase [Myxococcaceae bacterium]
CSACAAGQGCGGNVCAASPGGGAAGGSSAGGAAGGSAGGGGALGAVTWYRDVLPVTQTKCQSCHRAGGIGPFALETYAQARPMAAAMKSAVVARRMPPWMPSAACGTPFVNDFSLTQAQIDTLAKWADDGAPEGNPADAPTPPGPVGQLPRVDATLTMSEPYTPSSARADDYRCFLVDPALAAARFVTGYDVTPGVTAEVHHVIVYIVDRAAARTKDMGEAGPGWTCYGDSGIANSPGPIGAWAPGISSVVYPAGTGIRLQPSQALAMQVHYNTNAGTRSPDQTSVRLMYAPQGTTVTSATLAPLVADGFAIPPNATNHTFSRSFPNPTRSIDLKVYGLMPHMHTLGKRITLTGVNAPNAEDCLIDIPRWDFHWQSQYFRQQPYLLSRSGSVKMTCTWDNPTSRTVRWGEGTEDEMCFAYVYVTP